MSRADRGPLLRFAPYQHTTHVFGVAELTRHIASLLESDVTLADVWLRGEIAGLSRSPAGHSYFALKDDAGQLRCVLFRGNSVLSPVQPANGLAIVAHGSVRFYERSGACELVADLLFPEGVGLAHMQRESLQRRLEAEGFFDTARKRPLPPLPNRIGVITSARGAVIHDLLSVLGRRYPLAEVVFVPAPVQGAGAAAAMERALARVARADVDLVVLARGGGSDEDLAAFNEERLARAVFACRVPVVSAVGHERDLTLVDLVADLRAATPSAAAEMIAPDVATLRQDVDRLHARARGAVDARLASSRQATRVGHVQLARALQAHVRSARDELATLDRQLAVLDPHATLARGYAIARVGDRVLRDAREVAPGQAFEVQLQHGALDSTVTGIRPPEPDVEG